MGKRENEWMDSASQQQLSLFVSEVLTVLIWHKKRNYYFAQSGEWGGGGASIWAPPL